MHRWVAVLRHPREASNKDICAIWFLGQRQKNDIIIVSCKWGKGRKNPKPQKRTSQPKPTPALMSCPLSAKWANPTLRHHCMRCQRRLCWEPRAKQYFTNKTHPIDTSGTSLKRGRNCSHSPKQSALFCWRIFCFFSTKEERAGRQLFPAECHESLPVPELSSPKPEEHTDKQHKVAPCRGRVFQARPQNSKNVVLYSLLQSGASKEVPSWLPSPLYRLGASALV